MTNLDLAKCALCEKEHSKLEPIAGLFVVVCPLFPQTVVYLYGTVGRFGTRCAVREILFGSRHRDNLFDGE